MLRYRLLMGFLLAATLSLAFKVDIGRPILEHYGLGAVFLAYAAGVVAQKFPAPRQPDAKSFRLLKGADKW